jgi:hypothetical protein
MMTTATRTTAAVTDPKDDTSTRQPRDEAWWTGPLLAPSASTLPHGHLLIEPYVYDLIVYGHYDDAGAADRAAREHNYGSLTYVLYGVTDRLTVGAIPRFGLAHVVRGNGSSGAGVGDVTVQAQYRLALFEEGRRVPTFSLTFGETFPTGKYNRLSSTASDALGSGAYTSVLSAFSQSLLLDAERQNRQNEAQSLVLTIERRRHLRQKRVRNRAGLPRHGATR